MYATKTLSSLKYLDINPIRGEEGGSNTTPSDFLKYF